MRLTLALLMLTGSVWADSLKTVREQLVQGGFYIGRVDKDAKVTLAGEPVPVTRDGLVVVGFDRFQPEKNILKICVKNECEQETLWVKPREYVVQNVKGVPPASVNPSKKELARMEKDNMAIGAARATAVKQAGWSGELAKEFSLPIKGVRTSGVYGSRRTYNGEERSWHKGHDLAAKTGTIVRAPAAGVVRLARDTFMNGNIIFLDHGGGISSAYAHLSKMDVKVGDRVERGQVIGKVGTTGRSSGPHLHWGMYWQNMAIDPILWVNSPNGEKD